MQQPQSQPGAPQPSGKWEFDPVNSCVSFVVRHFGVAFARGVFKKVQAQVVFDSANIPASSVTATIEMSSLDTNNQRRDDDVRAPGYLDVQAHPTMTFQSKRIEPAGQRYKLIGDLTLKGVTKEVVFDMTYGGVTGKDGRGLQHAGFTAEGTINRRDFGVNGDVFMPDGSSTVADNIKVVLDIELRRMQAT